ncbi:MAG: SdrD B-like domain-containing protein [Pseudomonadota bacterium]
MTVPLDSGPTDVAEDAAFSPAEIGQAQDGPSESDEPAPSEGLLAERAIDLEMVDVAAPETTLATLAPETPFERSEASTPADAASAELAATSTPGALPDQSKNAATPASSEIEPTELAGGTVSVFLLDASANSRIAEIEEGDTFTADLFFRDKFSLGVETLRTDVASARLSWLDADGNVLHSHVDNTELYTLYGDSNGQVINTGASYMLGMQSLRVELFSGANATGAKRVDETISFTLDPALPAPVEPEPRPVPKIDPAGLVAWADQVIFDYDGNQGDPDDIVAMPIAALMAKAAGITDKTSFFYGNAALYTAHNDLLPKLEQSAVFARSLGIDAYSYQDDPDAMIARLAAKIETGEKILLIEGGRLDAIYAALNLVDPALHKNVTMLSHSIWNENGTYPTWSDMQVELPDVTYVRITDQNNGRDNTKGFRNDDWAWMDGSSDAWVQEARSLMELGGSDKVDDPSDAGMLYYALTGDERGDALDVKAWVEGSALYDDPVTEIGDDGRDTTSTPGAFKETGGIVVIEAESAGALPDQWKNSTTTTSSDGIDSPGQATNGDFIVWEGADLFSTPGVGVLTYQIEITTAGVYQFQWRSQIGKGNQHTEHNDSWLRIHSDQFYGYEAASDTYVHPPGAAPGTYPEGASESHGGWNPDGWLKVFSSKHDWTWSTKTNDGSFHDIFAKFDAPGVYTLEIAARSSSHVIDRLVLHHVDYAGDPYDLNLAESERVSEPEPPETPVATLYLVNADTDTRLGEITDEGTVNLSDLNGGSFALEAETSAPVGSVRFTYGSHVRVESVAPYALFGDADGDFAGQVLSAGAKSVTVEMFSGSGATGTLLGTTEIDFTVTALPAPTVTGEVAGRFFIDGDHDGENGNDADDPGVAGHLVQLYQGGTLIGSTTTNDNGWYLFEDVPVGDGYSVRFHHEGADLPFAPLPGQSVGLGGNLNTARFAVVENVKTTGVHGLLEAPVETSGRLEMGTVTLPQGLTDSWINVEFAEAIENAVVVLGPISSNGNSPVVARVRNVTDTGFEVELDEWAYLNGWHQAETLSWMAASEGTHSLMDGTVVQAGSTSAVNETAASVSFAESFEAGPLVFAQVTTERGSAPVTSRLDAVSPDGFDVQLQEEEGADGAHAREDIDWIAVENSSSIAFSQAGTISVDQDWSKLRSAELDDVFLADMQTMNGADTAALRYDDRPNGRVVRVQEEGSSDDETSHADETVGYLIGQSGSFDLYA